jgi:hypothetical protein
MRTLRLGLVVVLVSLVAFAGSAAAAAPRIVIFSGGTLTHRVVVSDWPAIFRFYTRAATGPSLPDARLAGRPRVRLSLFWGPRWIRFLADGNRPSGLRAGGADQTAFFYPAWHGRPALLDTPSVWDSPRRVSAVALRALGRLGVPIA